ncbi:replication factor C subunit 5-like isoform X2 [Schistocerca gregaria]|uniref:replication factor C subunit 5-like isoform X2 n=1 Tax=Schistocerca gregaria TaxID=7010 RepID=UPI00211F18CA|nr:replication factor C subunit 5-like isoform X2 [Schistocerca gregaria]
MTNCSQCRCCFMKFQSFLDQNALPHLLLYGPPGTGKTTCILAVSRALSTRYPSASSSSMTLELNASDDRTISTVRDRIKDFVSTKTFFSIPFKLVILDEADAMTADAQAALRRIIEQYSKNTRFCLICNHLNKISLAIQSRCTRFRFGPPDEDQMLGRLQSIVQLEKVQADTDALKEIIKISEGDMRTSLNILQATAMAFPNQCIQLEHVYASTGNPSPKDVRSILETLLNAKISTSYERILQIKQEKGYALRDLITHLHKAMTTIKLDSNTRRVLLKCMADIEYRLAAGASENVQLAALIGGFALAREQMDKARD